MDRKIRNKQRKQPVSGRPEKKHRLHAMHEELSIEEKIQLAANNKLYTTRKYSKGVRLLTVCLYLVSISITGASLAVYYVYFWRSHEGSATRNLTAEECKTTGLSADLQQITRTLNTTSVFYRKLVRRMEVKAMRKEMRLLERHMAELRRKVAERHARGDDDEDYAANSGF